MTEYGSSAFCLTAALTTFSTAFLMLFFLRYSCERTRHSDQPDENSTRLARLTTATCTAAAASRSADAHIAPNPGSAPRSRTSPKGPALGPPSRYASCGRRSHLCVDLLSILVRVACDTGRSRSTVVDRWIVKMATVPN